MMRADGLALHVDVGVLEQRRELGQRVVAAKRAEQVDGGPAHRRVLRVFSCSTASRPRLPKATSTSVSRRNARPRSSAASASASGRITAVPNRVRTAPSRARRPASSIVAGGRPCGPSGARRPAVRARRRRPRVVRACRDASASAASACTSGTADSKSPSRTSSSTWATASSTTALQRRAPLRGAADRAAAAGRAPRISASLTVASHAATRSGGSSLTCSTSTASVRAVDSSRA